MTKRKKKLVCKNKNCSNELPEISVKHNDPFCSTKCARDHHGVAV